MTDLSGQYLGRYYLTERLGEGGMAVVYKAYDTRLERDVAIKIIRNGAFPSDDLEQILKRFEREAKSLAKLSHPHIVKVYDYGEHEGSPYLVMEYLPGGTLKKMLGKPVPWQDAVRLILPVAQGIAYAHQNGILHRDIKPANILITTSGEPMLSDFGIAKLFEGDQTTTLTGSGMAIGTPEYMAPEQWAGTTSPQSDLYSLGIVLYEMVAGRKPYIADTPGAILIKQVTEPLPGPRKFVAEIPEVLEHVLVKALAREPADRYTDIHAFIHALDNLQVSVPVITPPKPKFVEATYQVPVIKHEEPVPTEVVTRVGNEPVAEKVEETLPARARSPINFSRRGMGIIIGGVVVILAVWLGSPLIGKLFTPAPGATATVTLTVAPKATIALTKTIPPTETITPTALPSPTSTITSTPTPLPAGISDVDPSGNAIPMRLVPAGKFTMGIDADAAVAECMKFYPVCNPSDYTSIAPHEVELGAYYIDTFEVTNLLYQACVATGVCNTPKNTLRFYYGSEYMNYPVSSVDWYMAKAYCEWRGAKLPTEAQWEIAARGTDGRTYPWGEGLGCSKANYYGCVGHPSVVGSYQRGVSPYGVYDMVGNVSEWVSSLYLPYPYNAADGREDLTAPGDRVMRDTGSGFSVGVVAPYFRGWSDPSTPYGSGFRCARSVGTSALQPIVTQTPTPEPVTNALPTQITDNKGVSMQLVPAGKFTMGSDADDAFAECKKYRNDCQRDWFTNEEPPHEVELNSFYIDIYEVTNILYKTCVTAGICDSPKDTDRYNNSKYENYPVEYVDWNMAKTYCEWRGAGLPTEAQWEKAARGTDGRTYPWGEGISCGKANYYDSTTGQYCIYATTKVGSYKGGVSPYGLYDMAGNVGEWVSDWYSETYYAASPQANPLGPGSGQYRVLRGSSVLYDYSNARSTFRSWLDPTFTGNRIGFRCARSP